jgi:hypothetical protein
MAVDVAASTPPPAAPSDPVDFETCPRAASLRTLNGGGAAAPIMRLTSALERRRCG